MKVVAVILAAGQGTRMRSKTPKVLHKISGKPMISILLRTVANCGVDQVVLVTGHQEQLVRNVLGDSVTYVTQAEQKGTGHAVLQTKEAISSEMEWVIVMCGDAPLVSQETLKKLMQEARFKDRVAVVVSMRVENPFGYGRVLTEGDRVVGIVEESLASDLQKQGKIVNTGLYCFRKKELFEALAHIPCHKEKNEYYLTDVIAWFNQEGYAVGHIDLADDREAIGINSRRELAVAQKYHQEMIKDKLMLAGVTFIDPASVFIEEDVQIGEDTVIEPFVHIKTGAIIKAESYIPSFSCIEGGEAWSIEA